MLGATVEHASTLAEDLLRWETRGPGDTENAMRRLARRYGVPYATFWRLRYRQPKDIYLSVYLKLRAAYDAERSRQLDRLCHDIEKTAAVAGADCDSVRAAQALVDAARRAPPPSQEAAGR